MNTIEKNYLEFDFLLMSACALEQYRKKKNIKQTAVASACKFANSASSVSKYLIDESNMRDKNKPKSKEEFNEIFNKKKTFLDLAHAIDLATAMNQNLHTILSLYEGEGWYANSTNLINEKIVNKNQKDYLIQEPLGQLEEIDNLSIANSITDINDPSFSVWMGTYYCYFSSTCSEEISKSKSEPSNINSMDEYQKSLYDIMPKNDHIFCGILEIGKPYNGRCGVELTFMSDPSELKVKKYVGTLSLARHLTAGFISLTCTENAEKSYIILQSPDGSPLDCRMAMVLTLSSIDNHRRPCAEKMLITKNKIVEDSKAYQELKALLPMIDNKIIISPENYAEQMEKLSGATSENISQFAKLYSSIESLAEINNRLETYVKIPEDSILNTFNFTTSEKAELIQSLREKAKANWYYKSNTSNATRIHTTLKQELHTQKTLNDIVP